MINISISKTAEELGARAADRIEELINQAIAEKGEARIILSTGMSQFETLSSLVKRDIDWSKVEMFHLDEYIGLDESHPASFIKYLKERFTSLVPLKSYHFVTGPEILEELGKELDRKPVDVAVIGIGENGHIAFNDPPADFEEERAYKIVQLDQRCRQQQVNEGWFDTINDVPKEAMTMSVKEIMKAEAIVSAVPHKAKSDAVYNTITEKVNEMVPATILKTHKNWNLFLDEDSAGKLLSL